MDNSLFCGEDEDATFHKWLDLVRDSIRDQTTFRSDVTRLGLIYKIPVWLKLMIYDYFVKAPKENAFNKDVISNFGYVYQNALLISYLTGSFCPKHLRRHKVFGFWLKVDGYTNKAFVKIKVLCFAP